MLHTSYIEIDSRTFRKNLQYIKGILNDGVKYSSVVKGNAYGHGIEHFVPMAEQAGVDHFSVFSADEALRVETVTSQDVTVMIMGMIDQQQLEWAIENEIEFFVFNSERLLKAKELAEMMGKKAKVHLEIETGMNRTGFPAKKLKDLAQLFSTHTEHLDLRGMCTHYAGAESIANYYRIKKQYNTFNKSYSKLSGFGITPSLKHTACSAAAMRYPSTQMDMVRIGILQYGFFPSQEVYINFLTKHKQQEIPLKGIIRWKSTVMELKEVKTGDFIGYGNSYLANTPMRIAVIPVGYSHGFNRSLSNQGRVLIRGQRVPVIGTVNMNMMTVDITNVDGVELGDEVVIIGQQGDLEITVASFGDFSNQLNYELLTRLPQDIPRNVV